MPRSLPEPTSLPLLRSPGGRAEWSPALGSALAGGLVGGLGWLLAGGWTGTWAVGSPAAVALLAGTGASAAYFSLRRRPAASAPEGPGSFELLFDRIPVGALLFDDQGRLRQANPAARRLLGRSDAELRRMDWTGALPFVDEDGGSLAAADNPLRRVGASGEALRGLVVGLEGGPHPGTTWLAVDVEPVGADEPGGPGFFMTLQDLTRHKASEAELVRYAFQDPMTGLANRALFMDRLHQALTRLDRRTAFVAVLFLDLDRFHRVNESIGRDAGDRLLAALADRFRRGLRPEDTIARLGGDEFAILLEGFSDVAQAVNVAERVTELLQDPFLPDGHEVYLRCSMGLALACTGQESASDLVRDAEIAMDRAKVKGVSLELFEPGMNAQAFERLRLEGELRHALERGEFRLHYQPIVALQGGMVEGWEALLRWQHPERGLVPPGDFIPLAEETGLIVPIGRWVIEEASRQAMAWQRAFPADHRRTMSVNLSVRQFQQRDLVAQVAEALRSAEADPSLVKLEITESLMMRDPRASLDTVLQFRDMNLRLAIDDFGTGYSSLSYLKRFPVDTLKVDKSFVDGLGKDPGDTAIVEAVLGLAKALGLRVTAEGIETADQLAWLRRLGCDHGQGYFFSRPLPPEAMDGLMAKDPRW